jgi:signal transduction histidine kinase
VAAARGRGPSGWTVRLRLTALYGGLFLVSGTVLLGITYGLVANRLPPGTVYVNRTFPGGGPLAITRPAPGTIEAFPVPGPPQAIVRQFNVVVNGQRSDALHQLLADSGMALVVMAVFSTGLGWMMAGRALRPLRAMTAAARDLSEHNLHERLPEQGPRDELRDLATTFNAVLGRLEGAFDSQRRFVANASHELRTPLTLERAILEVALADPDADAVSLRTTCERVLAIGAEQESLIESLITLARSQRGLEARYPVELDTVTSEVVESLDAIAAERVVTIEADLQPAVVSGDRRLVERLVANLIDNAVRHNHAGGWVKVGTGAPGGRPIIRVANSGPQIPATEVERLLQPFQQLTPDRTRDGDGIGLGLSIVTAIVTAHGGHLAVRPGAGGGLAVDVSLPASNGVSPR